MLAPPSFA